MNQQPTYMRHASIITPSLDVRKATRSIECWVCDIFESSPHASTPTNLHIVTFHPLTHPNAIGPALINRRNCSEDKSIWGWVAWPQMIAQLGIKLRQKAKSRDKVWGTTGGRVTFCCILEFHHGRPPSGPTDLTLGQLIIIIRLTGL